MEKLKFLLDADAYLNADFGVRNAECEVTGELARDHIPQSLPAPRHRQAGAFAIPQSEERPKYVATYIGSKQKLVDWTWRNTPDGVNVIAGFPDSGVNVWGQKTLQSQPSALDRINVRRLMMYIEEAVAESSRFVVFEPNNPQTWRALARLINPFVQTIKENGGLYEYAVQCDEETTTPAHIDRNELVCRVFVKPTKTAEFVELNFILVSTGGSFTEILNA